MLANREQRKHVAGGVLAVLIALMSASCGDDVGGPIYTGTGGSGGSGYCRALDDYYRGCCAICGPTDTYCTDSDYDVIGASEPWCQQELAATDTRYCYCDVF